VGRVQRSSIKDTWQKTMRWIPIKPNA